MHAIRQYEFGPAENLRYEEVPDPHPGPDQVRIAVAAAGVHLLDTALREGQPGPFGVAELPMTPGREVAGVVDELGEGVDADWLGKRVVAHLGAASGGYAELAIANAAALHALPDSLADDQAVAMIGTGRTALGVLDNAELTADDVVLVTAAAGGIGNLLVQAARNIGATVVGVAGGAEKVARVRELGATHAVDYTRADWPDQVRAALGERSVTAVLDGVGGAAGRQALELLGIGGRLILFGWSAGKGAELTVDDLFARYLTVKVALGPNILNRPGGLRALEERSIAEAAAGRLVPLVGEPFPLAQAAQAHHAVVGRGTIGKTVLKP
ncbi:zinc-binding dehydrogenase [Amycolatopsis anabasis]|uniref:zinc-binding dehydrogenase n=1 Tax=Amycolatopsis anabasis TaxID=1840409 RepID=UPI00131ABCAE|nr:zinc-binding dehydrogenase [Amycolatopsis anabasis]